MTYVVQMNDTHRVSALEAYCLQTPCRLFYHLLGLSLGDDPLRGGGIDENWFVLIICPVVQDETGQVHVEWKRSLRACCHLSHCKYMVSQILDISQ